MVHSTKGNKPILMCLISWEIFKKAFVDRFFPSEKGESNVKDLINICEWGSSVRKRIFEFH